jgi:hypothetical protein
VNGLLVPLAERVKRLSNPETRPRSGAPQPQ